MRCGRTCGCICTHPNLPAATRRYFSTSRRLLVAATSSLFLAHGGRRIPTSELLEPLLLCAEEYAAVPGLVDVREQVLLAGLRLWMCLHSTLSFFYGLVSGW